MPEEARCLLELGVAYIVDDVQEHKTGMLGMSEEDRKRFLGLMEEQGVELSVKARRKARERGELARKRVGKGEAQADSEAAVGAEDERPGEEDSLFGAETSSVLAGSSSAADKKLVPHYITPTTSYPPLSVPPVPSRTVLPRVPHTYPLFRYMHSKGYFLTPGLRFGCHYTIYPGDPLRYHSHFLATGLKWDQEFELLDVVGGGRLGTGVKKAYLIGGSPSSGETVGDDDEAQKEEDVRAFSIEWAGL